MKSISVLKLIFNFKYSAETKWLEKMGIAVKFGWVCRVAIMTGLLCGLLSCARRLEPVQAPPSAPDLSQAQWYVNQEGMKLFYHALLPAGKIRGQLVLLPGTGGARQESYASFIQTLLQQHWAVYLLHPRGTGYSPGVRGDVADFGLVIEDYRGFIDQQASRHPKLPLVLFGHSLGGALAVQLAADLGAEVTGVILVNPAYQYASAVGPTLGEYCFYAYCYLFRPAELVVDMSGDAKNIQNPDDRREALAREHDSLIIKKFSMRYMAGVKRMMDQCLINAKRADQPLLLLIGVLDGIVKPGSPAELFQAWNSSDKKQIDISRAGHGMVAVELGTADILCWLEQIIGRSASHTQTNSTTPLAFKGKELYSWQESGQWVFSLLEGTNRIKFATEITNESNKIYGIMALKMILGKLAQGETVTWFAEYQDGEGTKVACQLPPQPQVDELIVFCQDHGFQLGILKATRSSVR